MVVNVRIHHRDEHVSHGGAKVEPRGFEPLTSWLQTRLTSVDRGRCRWSAADGGLCGAMQAGDVAAPVAALGRELAQASPDRYRPDCADGRDAVQLHGPLPEAGWSLLVFCWVARLAGRRSSSGLHD